MVRTPSATIFISPRTVSRGRPLPSSRPTLRLRLSPPVQVNTRSPRPLKPARVSRRPPSAHAKRVISARPLVIKPARALFPRPSDSTTPAAIAMTFLSAPPSSTPMTSLLAYSRKYLDRNSSCTSFSRDGSLDATSTAVGNSRATSAAKLGPESTATGFAPPISSSITCDIRLILPGSRPFVALTIGTSPGRKALACWITVRVPCDGTAATTHVDPTNASSRDAVGITDSGSTKSGR